MATTIQISDFARKKLEAMKIHHRETFNDVIEIMIEDHLELSEETKKDLEIARKQIEEGKVVSHEEVKRRLGL